MRGFKLCDSSMLVKFRFIRISLGKQFLVPYRLDRQKSAS